MKYLNQKNKSRGMAMGLALIAIMIIGVMVAMFLQRSKSERSQVEMDSGRKILLSQANSTYDFLMDATIQALKEYTSKCSPLIGSNTPATLNLRDSDGQLVAIQTPCPSTAGVLDIDSGLWAKIESLVTNPDAGTRFKCFRGCKAFADFPKVMMTTIEQRDGKTKNFYVNVSGRFEVIQGSVSEFSVGAFAIDPTQSVKVMNGVHGDLALFFKNEDNNGQEPPPPPENPCYGGDQGNPVLQPRTIYFTPPQNTSLTMDSISTNVNSESLCIGQFHPHQWGENWAYSLTDLGTVNISKGAIITSSFFSEYRTNLLAKYTQGMNSSYWPAFNGWMQTEGGGGGGGGGYSEFNFFSSSLTPGLLNAILPTAAPIGDQQILTDVNPYTHDGGSISPVVSYAELQLGACISANQCKAKLVEYFHSPVNGQSNWTVFDGYVTPNLALYTQAPTVNVRKYAGDTARHATIGANNMYLFTSGEIRLKTSIVQHPGLGGLISDDPDTQGHLGLISTTSNAKIGADFETLNSINGQTLGEIYNSGTPATVVTVQIDAGLVSAAENRAPFEFVDGLLVPPQGSTTPKTIGSGSFKGPVWGAHQTILRNMNDQMTTVLSGFQNVSTEYPPSWRTDPRLSIAVSALPMARDLGRTFEFIDYGVALQEARADLGLN